MTQIINNAWNSGRPGSWPSGWLGSWPSSWLGTVLLAVAVIATGSGAGAGCTKDHCENDTHCRPGEQCNLDTNQCFTPTTDAGDAQADAGDAQADAGDAEPTDCTEHSECTNSLEPVCLNLSCEPCDNPAQCLDKDVDRPYCEGGQCLQCTDSETHCTTSTLSICNAGTCEPCVVGSSDCATHHSDTPVCLNDECVQCTNSADHCNTPGPTVCDSTTNTCRPCEAHSECDYLGGICDWDTSECMAPANIIYVDDDTGCSNAGTGLSSEPFCEIQAAVDAVSATRFTIHVADGVYDNITITDKNPLWIVGGPGAPTISQAMSGDSMVLIDGTSNVKIENLVIQDAGGAGKGVSCEGSGLIPVVVLDGNAITGNNGGGIYISSCTITLEANDIYLNSGGGVDLSQSAFDVFNNMITLNGGPGTGFGGVQVSGIPGTTVFHSNTVVDNQAQSLVVAGVKSLNFFNVVSSIVDGTATPLLSAECTPSYSYIGDNSGGITGTGNIDTIGNPDPGLDSNYLLDTGSPCIDTGDDTGSAPTHDFEGQLRDATPDIGADEYYP